MKTILSWVAIVLVAALAIGAYFYPKVQPFLGSAAGSTFNDAKIAAIDMSPATSAASTTSILNTDSSARWLDSAVVACTGVATSGTSVASLSVQAATSTIAGAGLAGNTNLALNITVSTSTAFSQNATTTVVAGANTGGSNASLYYWPSGTYLSFLFNSTNAAACIVKVGYTPS